MRRSFARVAMVYSQQTASFYGGEDARAKVEDPALGFYQALVEARIPFEMVHDHLLDPEHIDRFKTLILPNIAALSTQQCDQIRAFVEQGEASSPPTKPRSTTSGAFGATTSAWRRSLAPRSPGSEKGPLLNSYLSLEKDPATGQFSPLLAGFEDATRIINGTHSVTVTPLGSGGYSPLLLVPSYPDLPMEEVFTQPAKTREPGVLLREIGRGRVVYFPADIDRTFWEVLDVDQAKLLRNAVLWATNEPAPVTVEGKGVLDISVWSQKNSMTVHLVNLTNPMMMKGPLREVIPLPNQEVSIRIPEGRRVSGVRLLVAGGDAHYRKDGGSIRLTVPSIGVHEVVALDFS